MGHGPVRGTQHPVCFRTTAVRFPRIHIHGPSELARHLREQESAGQHHGSWSTNLVDFRARSRATPLARSLALCAVFALSRAFGISNLASRRVCIALRDCCVFTSTSVRSYSGRPLPASTSDSVSR